MSGFGGHSFWAKAKGCKLANYKGYFPSSMRIASGALYSKRRRIHAAGSLGLPHQTLVLSVASFGPVSQSVSQSVSQLVSIVRASGYNSKASR